ncbi:MAG: DUF1573 domain-containing protein [Planctomycetota bacterium]
MMRLNSEILKRMLRVHSCGVMALFATTMAMPMPMAGTTAYAQEGHEGHDHAQEPPQEAIKGGGAVPFKMKQNFVDMGPIRPNTSETVVIELFNATARPVPITRVSTTCTCVSNEETLPKIVQPGEVGTISVTFKGRPNPGVVQERVTIWYENEEGRQKAIAVPVKGEIAFPVKSDPFYVNLLLPQRSGTLTLSSTDGVPFRVLSAGGEPPVFPSGAGAGELALKTQIIEYDFTDVPDDQLPNFYVIQTTHPETPLLDLRVIHKGLIQQQGNRENLWSVSQDRFPLGRMSDGQSHDVTVTVVGMPDNGELPTATTSHPMIKAEVVEERENDRKGRLFAIKFTVEGVEESLLTETMTLSLGELSKTFDVFVWTNPSD